MDFTTVMVLVIVAILIWILYPESVLDGFWSASKTFCDDAEIDLFTIYFGPGHGWSRPAFLLVKKDGKILFAEACTVRIAWRPLRKYNLTFENLDVDGFPLKQQARIEANGMKFMMYHEDTLYGEFYRDLEINEEVKK